MGTEARGPGPPPSSSDEAWCKGQGPGERVGSAVVCGFPQVLSFQPCGKEESRNRGGSRKETLNHRRLAARHAKMAAAPLGFKVPGKACVLP